MSEPRGGAIRTARAGRVLEVTIDHPPVNVLTIAVLRELDATLADALGDARAVILRAAGPRFSAGADIREHLPDQADDMLAAMRAVIGRLLELDAASVAAIHGDCLGGGLELVAACDLAVAAETAKLGQPEIAIGCFAPFAAALLPAQIGAKNARRLLLTGEPIDGAAAARIGLVDEACPADELPGRARALAETIARHSGAAIRACRRATRIAGALPPLEGCDEAARLYSAESVPTRDYVEGLEAFLEKRAPRWRDE